jgi:phosphatidate cytidylyltransferase
LSTTPRARAPLPREAPPPAEGAPRVGEAAPPEAPAPPGKVPGWSLRWRIASGLLFVPLLILLARAGGLAFVGFVALQVTLGLIEFYRMMRGKALEPHALLGVLTALGMLWVAYHPHSSEGDFLATAALLLVLALSLRRLPRARQVESMAVTLFGVLYVGWLSAHLVLLRELPWRAGTPYVDGAAYVLLAFFVTWSCDTGAYAVGRLMGRTHPWTLISPRKSLEGSAGGLVAAVIAAFVARLWFAPFLRGWDAAALGLLVGVFAQVGDLVESLLKRDARHGDSSDIIPGHGGILDRFDSLYFAAPLVFYYLKLVVFRVP